MEENKNIWENYTLLDFLKILNLPTDEVKENTGDVVQDGKYLQFISQINRFNRLLEKLYCVECNYILYPVETSHFASYTVVKFSCQNHQCKEHNNVVYLNHCLNGKCNSIIDSRETKKCPHDLYICPKCGSCCSHAMFVRRKSNLENTGGNVHNNLVYNINYKLGHLERGEYFCYKCTKPMEETKPEVFECLDCKVKYENGHYKFKREHKGEPKPNENQMR